MTPTNPCVTAVDVEKFAQLFLKHVHVEVGLAVVRDVVLRSNIGFHHV